MNTTKDKESMPNGPKCPQCGARLPAGALEGLCPACLLKQGASADTRASTEGSGGVGPNGTTIIANAAPPSVGAVASLFPQLEILGFIGQGGMGAVYKARQPALDRLVALKILPPQEAGGSFSDRFTREARALARLNHPNIVAVYDFGVLTPVPAPTSAAPHATGMSGALTAGAGLPLHYFIMEFVDGLNLRQLEQAGNLSPREALQIIPQICDALQYAHDEGVVHRDIKPENVLMDRKGRVKIADFGLAKILGREPSTTRLTGEGQVMGTPHYMAPEQIEHPLQVDHRADIYSLGVVFYEMLTGELPLGRFAPPSQKVQVDVRLDEVVLHALEKEPRRRYQHASEVKTDVETIAGGGAAAPAADAATVRARREVKAPASWLVATGVLNWIAVPFIAAVAWSAGRQVEPTAPMVGALLAILFLSSAIILAGLKMARLEAYRLAIAGSVLAIFITPGNIIGLPIGIWSLTVLLRRDVRAGFTAHRLRVAPTMPADPAVAPGAATTKSPWLRMLEIMFDESFTSPLAMKLVNISALGFIGCLGFLGYLPFSGAQRLFGLFGFSGLFGLIGAAFIVERCARRRATALPPRQNRGRMWASLLLGLLVFLVVFLMSTVVTLRLSQTYVATARVTTEIGHLRADPYFIQNQRLRVTTEPVLSRVIRELDLRHRMERLSGVALSDEAMLEMVRTRVNVQQTPRTSLLEIHYYAETPDLAAAVANRIAEAYCALPASQGAEIVDRAEPPLRPVRPNVPLNLTLGVMAGAALGLLAGGLTWLVSFQARPKPGVPPPIQPPARDRFWNRFAMVCAVGVLVVVLLPLVGGLAYWRLSAAHQPDAAPNVTVTGTVTDAATGKPIAGARVADNFYHTRPDRAPQETWTDNSGRYSLRTWYEEHAIAASAPGYETQLSTLLTKPFGREPIARLDFQLRPTIVSSMTPAASSATRQATILKAPWAEVTNQFPTRLTVPLFQVRLVAPEGSTAPTDSLEEIPGQRPLAVLREVLLDNSAVAQAGSEFSTTGRSIRIELTPEGTRRFATITATNLNRQLAIIVLGKVRAAPIIRTKIPGGQIVIGTGLSATECASIVDMLNRSPVRSTDEWTFRAPREITLLALHPEAFSDSRSPVGPLDHLRGWLDLDSGVVVTNQPRGWTTWIDHDWIRTHGFDLVAAVSSHQLPVLMGFDMVVERIPADNWDGLTAADVVQSWSLMQTRSQPMQHFGLAPGQSDTFIFLTAEGGRGVLQILGLTGDFHSVRLRYKLVRSNPRAAGAAHGQ